MAATPSFGTIHIHIHFLSFLGWWSCLERYIQYISSFSLCSVCPSFFYSSRWFVCQYSPIVLRLSPTPKSVDDDKLWSDLPRRLSSSSSDACNSTVSSLVLSLESIKQVLRRTTPGISQGPTRSRARAFGQLLWRGPDRWRRGLTIRQDTSPREAHPRLPFHTHATIRF